MKMLSIMPGSSRREKGVALILALSILSLLLILAMSFAFTARTDKAASANYAHSVKSRLLAESGLSRVIGFVQTELSVPVGATIPTNFAFPGNRFYTYNPDPDKVSHWKHRTMLFSVNLTAADTVVKLAQVDSEDRVAMKIGNAQMIPKEYEGENELPTTMRDFISWENIMINGPDPGILGRYAYSLFDMTGMIDPNYAVDPLGAAEGGETRTGASLSEISLLFDPADDAASAAFFRNQLTVDNPRWFSYPHIFRSAGGVFGDDTAVARVMRSIFPYTVMDPENYWHEDNGDLALTDNELLDRFNLALLPGDNTDSAADNAIAIYDMLTGGSVGRQASGPGAQHKYSQWVWRTDETDIWSDEHDPERLSEVRRRAARIAANFIDYSDVDDTPTLVYVGPSPSYSLTVDSTPTSNWEYRVRGTESVYGLGEVLAALKIDRQAGVDQDKITITPQFRVEVFKPNFAGGAATAQSVQITFSYVLEGNEDTPAVVTISKANEVVTIPLVDPPDDLTYGLIKYNDWVDGAVNGPFADAMKAGEGDVSCVSFVIHNVTIFDANGTVVRELPERNPASVPDLYTYNGPDLVSTDAGASSYFRLIREMHDPLNDGYHQGLTTLFGDYVVSTDEPVHHGDVAGGGLTALPYEQGDHSALVVWDYDANEYGDVDVANLPFVRLGEIGRVHSYRAGQSLRLWSANDTDTETHDAYLLDMFKVTSAESTPGRININSRQKLVLDALFYGTGDPSGLGYTTPQDATTKLLRYRINVKAAPFTNIGELGNVPELCGNNRSASDAEIEDRMHDIAEMISVRKNSFMVVLTAEALRDLPFEVPGAIPWTSLGYRYAGVQGETKILAILEQDAFLNTIKLVRMDYIYD